MLSIRTFGRLAVWVSDVARPAAGRAESGAAIRKVTFETRTVQALLVCVAYQGRALGRDLLAELIWPERSQPQAGAHGLESVSRALDRSTPAARLGQWAALGRAALLGRPPFSLHRLPR
jgi:hypothetical protein